MQISIERFKPGELDQIAKGTILEADIDYDCEFIVASEGGKIIGVIGINFLYRMPKLQHILIVPKYRKTRLGFFLMRSMEACLETLGFNGYASFIDSDIMMKYARKWGMEEWQKETNGMWFVKKLKGENYERKIEELARSKDTSLV